METHNWDTAWGPKRLLTFIADSMKGPAKSSFSHHDYTRHTQSGGLVAKTPRPFAWQGRGKQNSFNLLHVYTHISGNEGVSNSFVCFYTSFVQIS